MTDLAPVPTHVAKAKIYAFAEDLRKQCNVTSGFDLDDLVHNNNGRISHFGAFSENQTDALIVEPDGRFEIRLSSSASTVRNHFVIAHELGHYLLHLPMVRKANPSAGMRAPRAVDRENQDLLRCEMEANWFAEAFLMPEEAFRDAIQCHDFQTAADQFGVSVSAVRDRALSLGTGNPVFTPRPFATAAYHAH